jgi:hypothetical protein
MMNADLQYTMDFGLLGSPTDVVYGNQFTYVHARSCSKPSIWNVAAEDRASLCEKHQYLYREG